MKTKLITLEQGNIIVSDEEIKELNWCLDEERNIVFQFKHFNSGVLHSDNHSQFESKCQKIIAGLENQPIIDYSALSDEDCKKIGYIDVEKLANKYYGDDDYAKESKIGFIKGFKTAQSLNDKKFSLEDMKKAYYSGRGLGKLMETHDWDCFEKSLQQPKVFDIEIQEIKTLSERGKHEKGMMDRASQSYPRNTPISWYDYSIKITKIL